MGVAQQWLAERLRVSGEENALMAHGVAAPDFFHGGVNIPEWR